MKRLAWQLEPYRGGRRISLHVPEAIVEEATGRHPLPDLLAELCGHQVITTDTAENGAVQDIHINSKTIGRIKNTPNKHYILHTVHKLVAWLGMPTTYSLGELEDPKVELLSFYQLAEGGDFGFGAEVELAKTDDVTLARAALDQMVTVAYDIRMFDNLGNYEQYFVTDVDRQLNGVTLHTNGHSSVHTLGEDFRPGTNRVELWGNNVWDAEEPLIYLAGAIALAYADELETP